MRLQKLQEEADLKTALETLGMTSSSGGIDGMNPTNKTEFTELADAISKKLSLYKNKEEYTGFLEDLIRSICANCKFKHFYLCCVYCYVNFFFLIVTSLDIRKIKTTMDTVYLEKQKLEKEKTKKGKAKAKAGIRMERDNASVSLYQI